MRDLFWVILTDYKDGDRIFINGRYIQGMWQEVHPDDEGLKITKVDIGPIAYMVKETPEEIIQLCEGIANDR